MSSFPSDLIEEVLDVSTNATLASCALVSRDLSELSRSRLYRSFTLSNGHLAAAPDGIATTSSHLLQYVRHIQIHGFGQQSITQDIIQIFQVLVHYGNLIAISFQCPSFSALLLNGRYYLPHFTSLLRLESVKYVRAPVMTVSLSGTSDFPEGQRYMQALLLSKAHVYLELNHTFGEDQLLPALNLPVVVSHKPLVQTLQLHTTGFHRYWKWLISYVTLSHLRRLRIVLNHDGHVGQDTSQIFTDLCHSLPESLSELSISTTDGVDVASSLAPFGKFHSLKCISFDVCLFDNDDASSFFVDITSFMERISKESHKSLRRINMDVIVLKGDFRVNATILIQWKTMAEIVASFNSSVQMTLQIEPASIDAGGSFTTIFLPGFHVGFKCAVPMERFVFSRDSEEFRRDLKFGWEKE